MTHRSLPKYGHLLETLTSHPKILVQFHLMLSLLGSILTSTKPALTNF